MSAVTKFSKLYDRLKQKIRNSATPITGFEIGLSGTDSILTFILLNELSIEMEHSFLVEGVHYVNGLEKPNTMFARHGFDWLRGRYPKSSIQMGSLLPPHTHDNFIWADLHTRAVTRGKFDGATFVPTDDRFWVVSSMNATEKALGTYSIMNKSASIAPITTLYKSEVLEICQAYMVPEAIITASKTPDCLCGRDEFAAENIQLIDDLIRGKLTQQYTGEQLTKGIEYIAMKKADGGFKERTPYTI